MINVTAFRVKGQMYGYKIEGHANYAPNGKDIVCAAISTLGQTTIHGLREVLKVRPRVVIGEAMLICNVPLITYSEQMNEIDILLRTFYEGVRLISEDYPKYVRIIESEEGFNEDSREYGLAANK
jgi:uncharacterized protein YsxB (DUF464 family)